MYDDTFVETPNGTSGTTASVRNLNSIVCSNKVLNWLSTRIDNELVLKCSRFSDWIESIQFFFTSCTNWFIVRSGKRCLFIMSLPWRVKVVEGREWGVVSQCIKRCLLKGSQLKWRHRIEWKIKKHSAINYHTSLCVSDMHI